MSINRRRGGGFDVTQVLFMLLGLLLGAGLIFVVGLQVGERLDPSAFSLAETLMESGGDTRGALTPRGAMKAHNDDFSFFSDLTAPAPERRRRNLKMPSGNANDPRLAKREARKLRRLKGQPAKARRLARRGTSARQGAAKSGARQRSATPRSLSREALGHVAPPSRVDREEAPAAAPVQPKVKSVEEARDNALGAMSQGAPAPRKASAAAPQGRRFTIEVGSFKSIKAASATLDRLKAQGHSARISLGVRGGEKVYRVRVGRFGSRDDAQRRLSSAGLRGSVTPL